MSMNESLRLSILAGDFGGKRMWGHPTPRQGLPPLHPAFTLKGLSILAGDFGEKEDVGQGD